MDVNVEEVVRENIGRILHLSLATASENKPWVCEVHFAYDDGLNLYFRSLKSRRHSLEIAKNSNVAGNIIDKHEITDTKVLGIYFEGRAAEVDETEAAVAARVIAKRLRMDESDILEEHEQPDKHRIYKISVSTWYVFGRFGEDATNSTKHRMEWS